MARRIFQNMYKNNRNDDNNSSVMVATNITGDDEGMVADITTGMEHVVRIPGGNERIGTYNVTTTSGEESYMTAVDCDEDQAMDIIPTATDVQQPLPPTAPTANGVTTTQQTSTLTLESLDAALRHDSHRPYDDLGPPSLPIEFDRPRFERGRRDDVLCYIPETDTHQVMHNVLFRDYSRECGPDGDNFVKQAYWPIHHKKPIKTIMGHVEICFVLSRCRKDTDLDCSQNDDENGSSSSSGEEDDDDDDDDVVFQITPQKVAVKVNYASNMERLRTRHAEDPLKEISAMQLIGDSHPNVLGCLDVLFDGQNLNVVMNYCDNGDVFNLLQETQMSHAGEGKAPGMSEPQARYWFRQIISGLQYLHSREVGICHRDLSPENLMLDGDGCLIIDMGMCLRVPYVDVNSRQIVSPTTNNGTGTGTVKRCLFQPQGACGKLPYMSPEIYRNRDPFDGEAADIFTTGTILFCMLTGNRSFQRPHTSDPQFYWMTQGLDSLLKDWKVDLSPEGMHLLKHMLQIRPRQRLTLHEVVNHPWFAFPDESPNGQASAAAGAGASILQQGSGVTNRGWNSY